MTKKLSTILTCLGACIESRTWAKDYADLQAAWHECKRSDWMLWLLARTTLGLGDPRLRLMACDFAEAALAYVPSDEDRPRQAIAVARQFANGEATREEMAAAGAAAGYAAWDAAQAAARYAAWDAQSDIIRGYFPDCSPVQPKMLARSLQ